MYECAVKLIKKGKAFVCDLTAEQIREYRGTLTEPGKESPYRSRSIEENLELFENMKKDVYKRQSRNREKRTEALAGRIGVIELSANGACKSCRDPGACLSDRLICQT